MDIKWTKYYQSLIFLVQEVNTCLILDQSAAIHLKSKYKSDLPPKAMCPGGLAGRAQHLPAHVHGPGVGGDAGGEHHGREHRQQVRRGRGVDQRQALQLPRLRRE